MALQVQIQVYQNGQMTGNLLLDGSKKVNKIGKTATSQIKIDDPAASRVHAVIEVSRTGVWLIDMGSSVGTLVNGTRINKAKLNNGDQITIGSTTLVVTLGNDLNAGMPVQLAPPMPQAAPPPMPQAAPPMSQAAPPMSQAAPPPMPHAAPPMPQVAPPPMPQTTPTWNPPAVGSAAPQWNTPSQTTPTWNVPGQNSAPQWNTPAVSPPPSQSSGSPFSTPSETVPGQAAQQSSVPSGWQQTEPTPGKPDTGSSEGGALGDSRFDNDDPALVRMRASTRRNRLIGGGVVVGIIVVTVAFVWLGSLGEAPVVEEASSYTSPEGAAKVAKQEGVESADKAGNAEPADGGEDAEPADGGEDAEPADEGEDTEPVDEGKVEPADDVEDSGAADDAKKPAGSDGFAAGEPRDEVKYLYYRLTTEQSLDAVAVDLYGDAGRVALLSEANPLLENGKAIGSGTQLRAPRYVAYEVKPGDTLGGIAAAELGAAKRYEEIFEANKDVLSSPMAVEVGMRLKIPILNE